MRRTPMRTKIWLLAAGLAGLAMGCGGGNASRDGEVQWVDNSDQDCDEISQALCIYVDKHESALAALADRADDTASDVSNGMPAALKARAELASEFALALQRYSVPSEAELGLAAATETTRQQCVSECIKSQLESLKQRVSSQIPASTINEFVEEARSSVTLACQNKGSMSHVTGDCLARVNPAQKARIWLQNRSDTLFRDPLKALIASILPVQQLVLFKTEMALNFASLSDDELDALYDGLVASKKTANDFIRLCEMTHRAMPLRVLDPVENWTHSVAEITGAIDTTASKCGAGCSPAWRKAAGR
jgi:hypothetical protein